jgi:hypothetical protein|tara:strand:- start:166 stop:561 length:396 start_codon:yes stop_codon:yes gene_type:complete
MSAVEVEEVTQKSVERPMDTYTEFTKLGWISTKQIPKVGSEVNVKINGIGRSVVKKYFVEHGLIGLLVHPMNPPTWYRKQNASKKDSDLYDWDDCHVFPAECLELEVRNEEGEIDKEFYNKALSDGSYNMS